MGCSSSRMALVSHVTVVIYQAANTIAWIPCTHLDIQCLQRIVYVSRYHRRPFRMPHKLLSFLNNKVESVLYISSHCLTCLVGYLVNGKRFGGIL